MSPYGHLRTHCSRPDPVRAGGHKCRGKAFPLAHDFLFSLASEAVLLRAEYSYGSTSRLPRPSLRYKIALAPASEATANPAKY